MQTHLTPAVLTALKYAQAVARQQGSKDVLPIHLLQGLLRQEEGRAAAALAGAGVDLAHLPRVFASVEIPVSLEPDDSSFPLSPSLRDALAEARALASELSDDHEVASDQMLLVLVQQEAELRNRLEELGLDFNRLREAIGTPPPPLPLLEPLQLADLPEQVDMARILDANANRAREALRVVEDHCRFVLDDAFLSKGLKELRHELTAILTSLPGSLLLEARETLRDVGTDLTTRGEQERFTPLGVVQANLKRLQEALRSLEEFGKLHGAGLGAALEKLRYRSYTLEKAIVLGTSARQRLAGARFYVLLTGSQCAASMEWTIQEAAAGGAQVVQLREKTLADRDLLDRARRVRRWTRQANVLFILNDRPDIGRLVEADGVHLGQDDLPIKEARRILGPDGIIGVSTHDLEQVRQAILDGASYLGVGPTFASATKSFDSLAGLEFVKQTTAETSLPAFVIGGVTPENLPQAIAAGARRVAVSACICQADNPRGVASHFRWQLDQAALP